VTSIQNAATYERCSESNYCGSRED